MKMTPSTSHPERPRPDARNSATTPARSTNQLRYPMPIVGKMAAVCCAQMYISGLPLLQPAPSACCVGNTAVWPILVSAA